MATGSREDRPELYGLGESPKVVTGLDLERMLKDDDPALADVKSVGFVLCAGSLDETHPYCSRTCCQQSIKNAIRLKEQDPRRPVYVWFKEVRTFGFLEEYYTKARELGVIFTRYDNESLPQVSANGSVSIAYRDPYLRRDVELPLDLLVLATPSIAAEGSSELSKMLKVPLQSDGFYLEAHVKLRPVDFGSEGIFLCGSAHYPKSIDEAISQAYAAAGRAAGHPGQARHQGRRRRRRGRRGQVRRLPHLRAHLPLRGADHRPRDQEGQDRGGRLPGLRGVRQRVPRQGHHPAPLHRRADLRQGRGALHGGELRWPTPRPPRSTAEAVAAAERPRRSRSTPTSSPRSSCSPATTAPTPPPTWPAACACSTRRNIRMIKLPCTGKLEVIHLLRAIEAGADGVYAAGCLEGECHYLKGNLWARKRVNHVKHLLAELGIEPERVEMYNMSSAMGAKFAESRHRVHRAHQASSAPTPSNVTA